MRLAAHAKHPYLAFERPRLDFGKVLVGKKIEAEVGKREGVMFFGMDPNL